MSTVSKQRRSGRARVVARAEGRAEARQREHVENALRGLRRKLGGLSLQFGSIKVDAHNAMREQEIIDANTLINSAIIGLERLVADCQSFSREVADLLSSAHWVQECTSFEQKIIKLRGDAGELLANAEALVDKLKAKLKSLKPRRRLAR